MSNAAFTLQELSPDQWNAVLASITQNYRGAHARLEVIGPDIGCQVEAEDRPFDGIAADIKGRESVVWIHFSGLDHGVRGVSVIRMLPRSGGAGPVVEVEDRDGVKTILTLGNPEEHELPPAQGLGRK
jgi:hypothetical protein